MSDTKKTTMQSSLTALLIGAVTLAFFAGTVFQRNKDVAEFEAIPPHTVTVTDTVPSQGRDRIIIRASPAVRESIYVGGEMIDEIARLDTILAPHADTLSLWYSVWHNTLGIDFRPTEQPTIVEHITQTKTLVERVYPFGPYVRLGLYTPWMKEFATYNKRLELGAGLSFQINQVAFELEPVSVEILNSKADFGFKANVRWFPLEGR